MSTTHKQLIASARSLADAVKGYDPNGTGEGIRDKAGAANAEVELTELATEIAAVFARALTKMSECKDGASCDY